MNTEGKLHLKNVTAEDFGAMRSKFASMKATVDELYATAEMAMSRNQLVALLENHYDLGTLKEAYEIFGGYVNRSFGVVMEKDGVLTDYFVRKYKKTVTDADIKVEHTMVKYAIEKGIDVAAGVIPTIDGKTSVDMEEEKEGEKVIRKFAVYDFLDGDDDYDWINTKLKPEEDYNFGELQAKFHNFTYGFDPGVKAEPPIVPFLVELKDHFQNVYKGLGIPPTDRFLQLWVDSIPEMLEMADKAHEALNRKELMDNMPVVCCHADYHPGNVKWKNGKCVGLFDFDWSKLDFRLFDVCFGLIYTCSSWDAQTDGRLWFDRCKYYLEGYNNFLKAGRALAPFTEAEKEAFPSMMIASVVYLLNWSTDYYGDWENLNDFEYFFYLAHIMKLIRYVDVHAEDLSELIKSV